MGTRRKETHPHHSALPATTGAAKPHTYASLIETVSVIIMVMDDQGSISYATPSFQWILGYETGEIEGRHLLDFIHPEDQEKIKHVMHQIRGVGGASLLVPEIRFRHQRGAWIWLEGDLLNRLEDEAIGALVINLYDITQRKLFEMDYARLLGAVRISTDCFFLTDTDGTIIFLNDAAMRILGTSDKNELVGRSIVNFISEDERKEMLRGPGISEGAIKSIEHHFVSKGNGMIPVESSVAVMRDSERKQIGFVVISRDITERTRVQAELDRYRDHLKDLVEDRTAQLTESMQKLRATLEGVVQSMAITVESRDPYTAGHQRRVAELACSIADEMGLDRDRIDGIRLASLIHDLGKIYVPAEILNRHGKLDDIEFQLIKKHPQVGFDILKNIDFPWPIAEIVYQHHERIDGSGYPRGLHGGDILPEARIIAVADSMEAMAIDRPYRIGQGTTAALSELRSLGGVSFDRDVVEACITVFIDRGFRFV